MGRAGALNVGWLPAALGLAWLLGLGTPGCANLPRPFDSEKWKAASHWEKVRCGMVTDLRRRIGLVGKTRADIVQLLGEADAGEAGFPTGYLLCPSFADIYILRLEWKAGRVSSAEVGDT